MAQDRFHLNTIAPSCLLLVLLGACPARADAPAPVPSAAALQRAAQLVREIYGDQLTRAHTAEQKGALAEKLRRAAAETANDPAGRYTLLMLARDMAIEAGTVEAALQTVDEAAKSFAIDALTAK